jgi:hypothetical protein
MGIQRERQIRYTPIHDSICGNDRRLSYPRCLNRVQNFLCCAVVRANVALGNEDTQKVQPINRQRLDSFEARKRTTKCEKHPAISK